MIYPAYLDLWLSAILLFTRGLREWPGIIWCFFAYIGFLVFIDLIDVDVSIKAPLIVFLIAIMIAAIEIEIEGMFGWAKMLPTWRKKLMILSLLSGGREITGYWLYVNGLIFVLMHYNMLMQGFDNWSWQAEISNWVSWFILLPGWDVMWFIFNPHGMWEGLRAGKVPWHTKLAFGWVPLDYIVSVVSACLLAVLNLLINDSVDDFIFISLFILLVILFFPLRKIYYRQYYRLRKT